MKSKLYDQEEKENSEVTKKCHNEIQCREKSETSHVESQRLECVSTKGLSNNRKEQQQNTGGKTQRDQYRVFRTVCDHSGKKTNIESI